MTNAELADALASAAAAAVVSANQFADESPKRAHELARADVLSRGAVTVRTFEELRVRKYECGRCGGTRFRVASEGASVVVSCVEVAIEGSSVCTHMAAAPSLWDALQAWGRDVPKNYLMAPDYSRLDEVDRQPPSAPEGGYVE